MKNLMWTEKYRPKTLDDIILDNTEKSKIANLIKDPKSMPHFLFVTKSPGTGKTSLAYVIKNEIKCKSGDFKSMNSSDERKIDHIREIKQFAMTRPIGKIKMVHMDEFDGVLGPSQNALRPMMEDYSSNCKFILTANDVTSIIEPIIGRCVRIDLKEPPREAIVNKLGRIVDKENLDITPTAIDKIVEIYYPNMRSMINKLQELSALERIDIKDVKTGDEMGDSFYNILKTKTAYEARVYAIDYNLDPKEIIKSVLKNLEKDASTNNETLQKFSWMAAEVEFRLIQGSDVEVQLGALIYKFKSLFG